MPCEFSPHIKLITRKANSVIGIIKCSFNCSVIDRTSYVLHSGSPSSVSLEYASEIWNPYLIGGIRALEKVQRRATKLVPELRDLDYTNRLVALNLPSLLYGCRRMDMITVYGI